MSQGATSSPSDPERADFAGPALLSPPAAGTTPAQVRPGGEKPHPTAVFTAIFTHKLINLARFKY